MSQVSRLKPSSPITNARHTHETNLVRVLLGILVLLVALALRVDGLGGEADDGSLGLVSGGRSGEAGQEDDHGGDGDAHD